MGGKKRKKNKGKKNGTLSKALDSISAQVGNVSDRFYHENLKNQAEIHSQGTVRMRAMIQASGTNLQMCDADPYGDGDQSLIRNRRRAQFLRDVWSAGGNFFELVETGQLHPFHMRILSGDVKGVEAALAQTENKTELLEVRAGVIRQTPLITAVFAPRCAPKMSQSGKIPFANYQAIVRILLREGAKVNARDIAGHTAIYFAAGAYSSSSSLKLLKDLVEAGGDVDLPDRFGQVVVAEAIIGNNLPAVRTLCLDYGANIDATDVCICCF